MKKVLRTHGRNYGAFDKQCYAWLFEAECVGILTVLLKPGEWSGRGSLLEEGASLGRQIECDLRVEHDRGGFTLVGGYRVKGERSRDLSVRIAPNDVGTYTIVAHLGAVTLDGIAKLESVPNLGLLWTTNNFQHASVALFDVADGYGFRGFSHEIERTLTWEIAFSESRHRVKADNVVTLTRRR